MAERINTATRNLQVSSLAEALNGGTLRIAPTFPEPAEIAQAAEGVAVCVLLAATEKLLSAK